MDTGAVVIAGAIGAGLGALAPWAAGRIGDPRYGEGTDGHDPEDEALAPLRSFASPVARAGSALVGLASFVAVGARYDAVEIVAVLCGLAMVLIVACLVDLRYLRLPNVLTYGGALGALAATAAVSLDRGRLPGHDVSTQWFVGGLAGGIGYAGFLFVVSEVFRLVRGKLGMGLGDVKLALSLGVTLGWIGWGLAPESLAGTAQYVVYGALVGNLVGAIGGLALTRLRPGRHFPFGPFLALGWLITIALQPIR